MALDGAQLIAAAQQQTGLSDLGDPEILPAFHLLMDSLNAEARLSEAGEQRVAGSLIQNLANRMQVEDWHKRHPELAQRPIEKPLFVFGLPRTGTTLTINLLASDPMRRVFMRFEAMNPVPPTAKDSFRDDPRFAAEQAKLEMSLKYMPHIAAMHWEDADSSTECQFAMAPSFCAQLYDSQYHIPSYSRWFLDEADYRPAFRYHKRLMQLLQSDHGGRWTFKNPWHPLFLDSLTEIYPDAQLAMTHRDPGDVVASACSLIAAVRPMFSDTPDNLEIADCILRTFDRMIERQFAYREKHGWNAIFDIQYEDQLKDPIGTMKALYAHYGEALSAEAQAAMQAMLADNPKGKHGKHDYRLEDYGLTRAQVYDRYADYITRLKIPVRG